MSAERTDVKLTEAQWRDLYRCVRTWYRTFGTYGHPDGDAIRLRTGRSLERLGLVRLDDRFSANSYVRWRPTWAGAQAVLATEDSRSYLSEAEVERL